MSQVQTKKVPMGQKIAFGVGMFANQMFPAILGIFMVVLVEDLRFTGLLWAMIYLFPRLFDAISDPIMGFISDNTKSKWGRRRQYVLIGGIIMGVAYIFMWQLFKENSLQYNFWYFFLWSVVFYLGLTFFSVPYVAMGYEMSDDFHERTNIMAIAQFLGQWAWVIAPWFWVIMYDPEWFPSADVAVRELAIWVAIPCAICAIVPAIFIKSESTLDRDDYAPVTFSNVGASLKKILSSFSEAFKIKQFKKLCISTFFIFNAFNTVASLTFFVIVYKLFNGDAGATGLWVSLFGCLGALGTTFLVIPIVTWLSKKFGKKKAFMIAQSISIIGYIMLYFLFIPGKPWLYIFALPFFSFGIGSLFTIMMSMTADVIDLDELNTGKRREGTFGAIYWWMVKVGFAIAGALSGLIIWLVGFNQDLPTIEQVGSVDALHAFFCFFPLIGTLAAMWVMKDYDIDEKRADEIRDALNKRKTDLLNNHSSAYGFGYLKPLIKDLKLPEFIGTNIDSESEDNISKIFNKTLNEGIYGLCFSPYLEGQDTSDFLTEEQVSRRMEVISPYTKWIRTFSCTEGHDLISRIAKKHNKNVLGGAWISNDKERNKREISSLIKLAKQGLIDVAAVGNEVLLRNEISEQELIDYIKQVKNELEGLDVKVGYVDTYYQYFRNPNLIDVCDVLLINCYPFWEGFSIDDALIHLRQMHAIVQKISNKKEIIITETGWPSQGDTVGKAIPNKINSKKYFVKTQDWAQKQNIKLFYFSSFDEGWKKNIEGEVGAKWGIWDKNEKLK
ncbi:MFS transporter [Winogradskyella litorisediminis]|uniref:Endo-1,3-beta-glucanase btgC n=1 Tax=Winogradskyella litorisediminis TaxID=1156618 RepID=A0ABW3N3L5_9FLAO